MKTIFAVTLFQLFSSFCFAAIAGQTKSANHLVIKEEIQLRDGQAAQLSDLLVENSALGLVSSEALASSVDIVGSSSEKKIVNRDLALQLRKFTRELPEGVRIIFPKELRVVPYNRITGSNLQARLIQAFKGVCKECRFEIVALNTPAIFKANPEGWSLQKTYELPKGNFAYQIFNTKTNARSTVSGRVKVFKKVPVAKRLIKMGESMSLSMVNFEYRDTTFAIDSPVSRLGLAGRTAQRTLTAGSVIWSGALKAEKIVHRGQIAKLLVDEGAFQLTMLVKPLQDGSAGETLRVRSLNSNKIMMARVNGKGSLVLE